ncbi:galactose-binding domain-like protein [Polychytrium aggregatum]|uniref:galactose-binding domain-like protein n=1 Tax=Polychytrium aggregatum TaxID=110093 RepID=UPI0022FE2597|nr:galactose-binding domain-like protein [Polychytrium aggregatum]KAI9208443.1 galactose-binding domain-like protein [Polychytrium aggregatum]
MSHCREEDAGHHHHDDDHHHHHDHEHDHDGPDRGLESSLFNKIDIEHVRCLNESVDGAGKAVFKHWIDRFDTSKAVTSDADEQLIFIIPFTGSVKLKSIAVLGSPGPSVMKAFINREDIDFDSADSTKPDQEWELVEDPGQDLPEYPTRMAKFSNVRSLALYFPSNFGADTTTITYIGFKGEWTEVNKDPIITIYELAANPADHTLYSETNVTTQLLP